jgi:hypothetical protein
MKLGGLAVPVLIASLSVAAIGGLGTLAVRASAVSTQTSIDLLRMNLRIARLHDELLKHSKDALASQARTLLPPGAVPAAAPDRAAENEARPWPETMEP